MLFKLIKRTTLQLVNSLTKRLIQTIDARKDLAGAVIIEEKINYKLDFSRVHTTRIKFNSALFESMKLDELFYVKSDNGTIVGNGIILNTRGQVVLESTIFQKEYLFKLRQTHLIPGRFFTKKIPLKNLTLSLSNALEDNYYHWIIESVTRIFLIESIIDIRSIKIVINDSLIPYKIDSLYHLFEIPRSNVKMKRSKDVCQGSLIIPSFTHTRNPSTEMTDICHPHIIRGLNEKVIAKLQSHPKKEFPSKLILSRRNASHRKILNEKYLLDNLEEKGFEIVEMESLSFEDQVYLFYNSQFVISTHGAGLTNIIFGKKITVIELFPEDRNSRDAVCFSQISSVLGFHHHLIGYSSNNKTQDVMIDSALVSEINLAIGSTKKFNT